MRLDLMLKYFLQVSGDSAEQIKLLEEMKSKLQDELEKLRAQLAKIEKECEDLNAIIVWGLIS